MWPGKWACPFGQVVPGDDTIAHKAIQIVQIERIPFVQILLFSGGRWVSSRAVSALVMTIQNGRSGVMYLRGARH